MCFIYLQENGVTIDLDRKAKDIAESIERTSKKYVEDYWKKKNGRDMDKNEQPTPTPKSLAEELETFDDKKKNNDSTIKKILDRVAKRNMHIYYNMLLPTISKKVLHP